MNGELAQAAWILKRLPSELAGLVIRKIFDTSFACQEGSTLHIQGRLLFNYGYDDDFSACYIAVRLGLVKVVKLTTYLIRPWYVYPTGYLSHRQVLKIKEDQFKVFQEIARGATLRLEKSDLLFLWLHKGGLEYDDLLALKYNLQVPVKNVPFTFRLQ